MCKLSTACHFPSKMSCDSLDSKMERIGGSADADVDDPPLCVSDSDRMFSVASLRAVWHGHWLDALKAARVGHTAPNSEVVRPADARRCRILEYARGARPLVLNFGSCT
uniref:Iodothyronine deiodinase n=1 Tax=Astyanax mexicanus TaxID=7994 RepID=A0A8B9LGV3_ASTMX